MPIYEYNCQKCGAKYDHLFKTFDTKKEKDVFCPKCKSKKKKKSISTFDFSFSNPVGTDRYNADHGYRYETKRPKIRAEREAALKAAGGVNPYNNIDDISSGKNFGEVK